MGYLWQGLFWCVQSITWVIERVYVIEQCNGYKASVYLNSDWLSHNLTRCDWSHRCQPSAVTVPCAMIIFQNIFEVHWPGNNGPLRTVLPSSREKQRWVNYCPSFWQRVEPSVEMQLGWSPFLPSWIAHAKKEPYEKVLQNNYDLKSIVDVWPLFCDSEVLVCEQSVFFFLFFLAKWGELPRHGAPDG